MNIKFTAGDYNTLNLGPSYLKLWLDVYKFKFIIQTQNKFKLSIPTLS